MFDDILAKMDELRAEIEAAKTPAAPEAPPAPDVVEMTVSPLTSDVVAALEAKGWTCTPPAEG